MPIAIQFGDLATRLARAFGVRGRVRTNISPDDTTLVAIAEDLSRPPFSDRPELWGVNHTRTPTTGQSDTHYVFNPTSSARVHVVRVYSDVAASIDLERNVALPAGRTSLVEWWRAMPPGNYQSNAYPGIDVSWKAGSVVTFQGGGACGPYMPQDEPWVLWPGDWLAIRGDVAATLYHLAIMGEGYPIL